MVTLRVYLLVSEGEMVSEGDRDGDYCCHGDGNHAGYGAYTLVA